MKTIELTLYKFDELSPEAQENALDKLWDINVGYDWWENVYEDAKNVGVEITGFDVDRGSYCEGDIYDFEETAHKIIAEHGETCETNLAAFNFLKERDEIIEKAEKDEDGNFADEYQLDADLDEAGNEFKKEILSAYLKMLRDECEYQSSREAIIETIEANEYDFNEDGTRY